LKLLLPVTSQTTSFPDTSVLSSKTEGVCDVRNIALRYLKKRKERSRGGKRKENQFGVLAQLLTNGIL
jgi:hypothetical protein